MNVLQIVKVKDNNDFIGRAASRGIVRSLNFFIANMVVSELRSKAFGVPVDQSGQMDAMHERFGNTLDNRNEQDENARGEGHEQQQREEQGMPFVEDRMSIAAKLKVIRDGVAGDLLAHARLLRNPFDPKGGTYPSPSDLGESLEETFVKQLNKPVKINREHLKAQAEALGLDPQDLERIELNNQARTKQYFNENRDEALQMILGLEAVDQDGKVLGDEDMEDVERSLPPIYRARIWTSADQGVWWARDREIEGIRRGRPDAKGNLFLIEEFRRRFAKEFDNFLRIPDVRAGIDDAVNRGSSWPTLTALTDTPAARRTVTVAKQATA